jgi:hypothetical protein
MLDTSFDLLDLMAIVIQQSIQFGRFQLNNCTTKYTPTIIACYQVVSYADITQTGFTTCGFTLNVF